MIVDHVANLLAALQSHAPNATAVRVCEVMIDMARQHDADENVLQLMLAGMLTDGLQHGNWPWNNSAIFARATLPRHGVQVGDHNTQSNTFFN